MHMIRESTFATPPNTIHHNVSLDPAHYISKFLFHPVQPTAVGIDNTSVSKRLHDRAVSSERLRFFCFSFLHYSFLFGSVRQIKLANRQLLGAR